MASVSSPGGGGSGSPFPQDGPRLAGPGPAPAGPVPILGFLMGSGPVSLYGSSNLATWNVVATNPPVSGEWNFHHLHTNAPTLFWYRAAEQR